jgi:hypothetical protein
MAGYTKEFLVDAFVSRYESLSKETVAKTKALANKCYDEHGKDKFRVYAAVDADAIRKFKLETGRKS